MELAHGFGSVDIGGLHVAIGPAFMGLGVELLLIIGLIIAVWKFPRGRIAVVFSTLFEGAVDFFDDILGKGEKYRVQSFVVSMFFIILISNLMGVVFEIFGPMFGIDEVGHPTAAHFFGIPTADLNFNMALAVMSILIMIFLQIKHGAHLTFDNIKTKLDSIGASMIYGLIIVGVVAGVLTTMSIVSILLIVVGLALLIDRGTDYLKTTAWAQKISPKSNIFLGIVHAVHDYVPVMGKNILEIEQGDKARYVFYPLWFLVKTFDIGISLFLGMLEIIGLFAKVLSLSFRLYGNMISGGILLGILLAAMAGGFEGLIGFKVTAVFPVIVYLQEILVALIQALVFPLLVAIFFKVVQTGSEA